MKISQKRTASLVAVIGLFLIITGCQRREHPLPQADPDEVGMSKARLGLIDEVIERAIAGKHFPGAVVLVSRKGKVIFRRAYGDSQQVPRRLKMDIRMVFDLASMTKPVATATSIMALAEQGKLSLLDKVKDYIPEFSAFSPEEGGEEEDARLWHLMTHTSGLPSYTDAVEVEKACGRPCPSGSMVTHIARLPKVAPPGKKFLYSCLGYITLGFIVEKVAGQDLARFTEEHIFKRLRMNHTFFLPQKKYLPLCVPTQVVNGKPLRGVVHDSLARLLGGVSGNAGLFSTVDDLAVFAQMMLNKGEYRGERILSPLTVERMTSVYPKAGFAGRGLGWDICSPYSSPAGDIFGPSSFGHTGYTGTSMWVDPETETAVILLTNRVHPDDQGEIISVRSRIANIAAGSIIGK
jgi:CubicO group peptidase (beta-lactamase class C family)